jgi:hypothetical protein
MNGPAPSQKSKTLRISPGKKSSHQGSQKKLFQDEEILLSEHSDEMKKNMSSYKADMPSRSQNLS